MTNLGTESILCGELLRGEVRPSDCGLSPDDFADGQCRAVFEAAVKLEEQRLEVSLVSLCDAHPALTDAAIQMAQLSEAAYGSNALQHSAIVRKDAQRRRLAAVGRMLQEAAGNGGEPSEMADQAWEKLAAVVSEERRLTTVNRVVTEAAVIERRYSTDARPVRISTGLPKLDALLNGGFRAGNLVIIGARPSVGKSALLMSFVNHAAAIGKRVLNVSLEMSEGENAERGLAAISALPVSWFVNDVRLTDRQRELVEAAQAKQNQALIEDYVNPGCTVGDIRQLARRMKASGGLDLIAVDYLGLMQGTGRNQTRNDEVAGISRGLKTLAMELSVPILAAHQLSRGNDKENRKPRLSDLRDSGAVEQDANIVLLLHDDTADIPGRSTERQISLKVAKNRQGSVGGLELRLNADIMQFTEV